MTNKFQERHHGAGGRHEHRHAPQPRVENRAPYGFVATCWCGWESRPLPTSGLAEREGDSHLLAVLD